MRTLARSACARAACASLGALTLAACLRDPNPDIGALDLGSNEADAGATDGGNASGDMGSPLRPAPSPCDPNSVSAPTGTLSGAYVGLDVTIDGWLLLADKNSMYVADTGQSPLLPLKIADLPEDGSWTEQVNGR